MRRFFLTVIAVVGLFSSVVRAESPQFEFQKGDKISLIGATLAERMQYFGHLEALLHANHPDLQLSFRNLAYSADEVAFRPRSLNFGEPDQHLTHSESDVVFAFFGFNESFKGEEGLEKFEDDLRQFVRHTLKQKYNGESAPRLVLFTPIPHEDLKNPNLPDGSANNSNIAMYSQVMKKVAAEESVSFVDLFTPTQKVMLQDSEHVTFNGVHLTDAGYKKLAPVFYEALLSEEPRQEVSSQLLAEVQEKDYQWFNRYRAVNGYYIYGARNKVWNNEEVMENERAKLDEMCAVVDQRIWKLVNGQQISATPDYSTTRGYITVETNYKEPIEILPPEEAIKQFHVADGYAVNLFASEVEFPDIENPVQITFDTQGRLWVATMPSYPGYKPPHKPHDKLLILEDTDGDGKADKQTVFADNLHVPTGFELGDGGVYVSQQPNLMFLKDTDGDGKADFSRLILHGFDSGDTHHSIGAFTWGPGGGLYMHEGTFHHSMTETPYGPVRNAHGGIYRYDPTTEKYETFVHYNFANPWGHVFDKWGQNFVADASGGANYFGTAFSGKAPQFTGQDDFGPFKFVYAPQMKQFFPKRVRPTAGCELVSSRHFPPEAQGNYLLNNVIGFQGILQHTVKEVDSGFEGKEIEPLLYSSDRNFRPTDIQFGPDGALYIVDWFNPLIGHLQHSIRDPNRDHTHGRIWRITYPSRPLVKMPTIKGASVDELLNLLNEPEDRTRYRVKLELRERPTASVVTGIEKFIAGLDKNADNYEHLLLETLWVRQHHNAVDVSHLRRVLHSPDYHARAAATRVLGYWRDDLPEALNLLQEMVNDDHPRVRLEAVRAASFFETPRAGEVALQSLNHEMDYYLDYTLKQTMQALEPYWLPAVAAGQPFAKENTEGIKFIISTIKTPDLINMARSEIVFDEMLNRHGVVFQHRQEAIEGLARLHNTTPMDELLETIAHLDTRDSEHGEHVLIDLGILLSRQPGKNIAKHRSQIEELTQWAQKPITRRVAFAALITADQNIDAAWEKGTKSIGALRDLVAAIPLIQSSEVRQKTYSKIEPLLHGLPEKLTATLGKQQGQLGRYVRVTLPGKSRTLTLAEVQVFSDGKNIAPNGHATQSSISSSGAPQRAIDGNTSGVYNEGSSTHTAGEQNPWWEVDLKADYPIEQIVVWNRTDGDLGNRIDKFKIEILDSSRQAVYTRGNNKVPQPKTEFAVKGDPQQVIREEAIRSIVSIPGHEADTFTTLAKFVKTNSSRAEAVSALSRLNRAKLPEKEVRPLIDTLLGIVEKTPIEQRTQDDIMEAIQLGKRLAVILPEAEARSLITQFRQLGVDVFFVRPVPHKMQYDRTNLYVEAGKPFEIVFENTDIMPHNLVLTTPGAREEVGILAEKLGSSPEAMKKQFIPDSDKVLAYTGLLQPGLQERLKLIAPQSLGEYPFVCTFPGHWRTMYGTIHVVKDISEIPLEQLDEPAEDHDHSNGPMYQRRFVRKWKVEDLIASLPQADENRSFENGRLLFKSIACVQCHQMKGEGAKIGPDLTLVRQKMQDGKLDRVRVLNEMIEPSKVIDEKYRTQIVINDEGKPYSGVIVYEDDQIIRLMANPLEKDAKAIEIPKDSIEERVDSKVSLMPEGLLNTLTKQEIFDLLLYIETGGVANSSVYK